MTLQKVIKWAFIIAFGSLAILYGAHILVPSYIQMAVLYAVFAFIAYFAEYEVKVDKK